MIVGCRRKSREIPEGVGGGDSRGGDWRSRQKCDRSLAEGESDGSRN